MIDEIKYEETLKNLEVHLKNDLEDLNLNEIKNYINILNPKSGETYLEVKNEYPELLECLNINNDYAYKDLIVLEKNNCISLKIKENEYVLNFLDNNMTKFKRDCEKNKLEKSSYDYKTSFYLKERYNNSIISINQFDLNELGLNILKTRLKCIISENHLVDIDIKTTNKMTDYLNMVIKCDKYKINFNLLQEDEKKYLSIDFINYNHIDIKDYINSFDINKKISILEPIFDIFSKYANEIIDNATFIHNLRIKLTKIIASIEEEFKNDL